MDIGTATHTAAAGPGTATASPVPARRALSSDFETFLKMLTAQMQNQDPLNPLESTDFAVQLATFSGVEQQVRTNDLLTALSQQLGAAGLGRAADWVGMEARVPAQIRFDGSPLTLYPAVAAGADSATLIVTDPAGREVMRQPIDPGAGTLDWAGVGPDGQPMAPGIYSFTIESRSGGKVLSTDPAEIYATISEVRLVDGGITVLLPGGVEIAADRITALRSPSGG